MGFEKYKKWTKVDVSHSISPPNKIFCIFWEGYDPNFAPKKFHRIFRKQYCQKCGQYSEKLEGGLS